MVQFCHQVSTNAFAVSTLRSAEPAFGQVRETNHTRVAVGLYCTAALLNHSCTPNALATFSGGEMRIVATRAIEMGETVTISYGPLVSKASLVDRASFKLQQQYRESKLLRSWATKSLPYCRLH